MDDSSTDARERSKEKPPSTISKHGTPGGTPRPSGRLQLLEAVASMYLPFVRQDIAGRMTRARARGFDVTIYRPAAFAKLVALVRRSQDDPASGSEELCFEHDRIYDDTRLRAALGSAYRAPPALEGDYLARFTSSRRRAGTKG